jgi:pimeloyl-ACP methyl ester carboxylesterase
MTTTARQPASETASAPSRWQDYGSPPRSAWLDIDWRQHLRSRVVHGSRVNYVEIGTGPPLVFVHGLSGCWQNWLENIPHFSRSHRVIAVDLAGFGESELPQEEISMPGFGRFIDAFLGEIGVERATLVGNSMGGFIAAETAISHPSRVEKLVLVSAAGGPKFFRWQERNVARIDLITRLLEPMVAATIARRKSMVSRPRLRRALLVGVARRPDLIAPELCYEVASGGAKPGFVDALKAVIDYDYWDRVPSISCPTLIVWGSHDRIVSVENAHEYERLIPDARLAIFEETGHVPMIERPGRFNRLLDEFLAETA